MANAESLARSSGFMVPLRRGQSLVNKQLSALRCLRGATGINGGKHALLIGLDVTDLEAIGTLALSAGRLATSKTTFGG